MADGDLVLLDQHRFIIKLLDAHSAVGAGPWVEVPAEFNIRSVWVDALEATATLQFEVSNAVTAPSAGTSGAPLLATALASPGPDQTTFFTAHRWMRAVKAVAGTTATTCIMVCARNE